MEISLTLNDWLSSFIDEYLKLKYILSYTSFLLKKEDTKVLLIFVDNLRPEFYTENETIVSNESVVLEIELKDLSLDTKAELFEFLKTKLNESDSYIKYAKRLGEYHYEQDLSTN